MAQHGIITTGKYRGQIDTFEPKEADREHPGMYATKPPHHEPMIDRTLADSCTNELPSRYHRVLTLSKLSNLQVRMQICTSIGARDLPRTAWLMTGTAGGSRLGRKAFVNYVAAL